MSELEDKLNTILGDPQAMGQIMALAQSLGSGKDQQPEAPPPPDHRDEPPPYAKLDRAIQIAKLSRLIRVALEVLRGGGQDHV